MTKYIGIWNLVSSEHWDEYMKAVGVGFAIRQIGKRISVREEIKLDGDTWFLDIYSAFNNVHLKFKLGEAFEEKTADGRRAKSTIAMEGGRLVQHQHTYGKTDSLIVREVVDDTTLVVTFEAMGKGIKAIRRFSRQTK